MQPMVSKINHNSKLASVQSACFQTVDKNQLKEKNADGPFFKQLTKTNQIKKMLMVLFTIR